MSGIDPEIEAVIIALRTERDAALQEMDKWRMEAQGDQSELGAALARAEKAEEFAEWLHKWKDAEEALADRKMTALQECNAQLAAAEAAIDAAARRIGYLGHSPREGEVNYETYAAIRAYRTKYSKKKTE